MPGKENVPGWTEITATPSEPRTDELPNAAPTPKGSKWVAQPPTEAKLDCPEVPTVAKDEGWTEAKRTVAVANTDHGTQAWRTKVAAGETGFARNHGVRGGLRTGKGLLRASSLRLRGEAGREHTTVLRRETTPVLRRERTDDSLRSGGGSPASRVAGGAPLRRSQSSRSFSSSRSLAGPMSRSFHSRRDPAAAADKSSVASAAGHIALNGTTFSSRCNKYVVHCGGPRTDDEAYLTPTQRSARDIKRLRILLETAYETVRQRDAEIGRLKQYISGELKSRRKSHASANSALAALQLSAAAAADGPEAAGAASPPDWSEAAAAAASPICCGDSGTGCECLTSASVSSDSHAEQADKLSALELEERLGGDWEATEHWIECEEQRIKQEHESKIDELTRQHAADYQEMKEKYNDRMEDLLQQLTEANRRYFQLRPEYDGAVLRARQLEMQLAAGVGSCPAGDVASCREMATQTTAALAADPECAEVAPPVTELIHQLHLRQQELDRVKGPWWSLGVSLHGSRRAVGPPSGWVGAGTRVASSADVWTAGTRRLQQGLYQQQLSALETARLGDGAAAAGGGAGEMDAATRLQFLRSAVYHCLTDRDEYAGHLKAIAALLRFSDWETQEVERARRLKT